MGLFDYFTREGKLKRHVRRMADRDTPAEDREISARWLAEDASPQAIAGLLTRFDMDLSQSTKDQKEKQFTYDLLIGLGSEAVDAPLRSWLLRCRQFAYPLRMLEDLSGEEDAIKVSYKLLEKELPNAFKPEKKRELLIWFSGRTHPEAIDAVLPFLTDFDEDVRYAAAEVMLAQNDDRAREPLLKALVNPEEDSNRLRHRLCQAFVRRGWSLGGADVAPALPAGFKVVGDRIRGA